VQTAIATKVTDAIEQQVDVEALLNQAFSGVIADRPRLQLLVGPLAGAVNGLIQTQVQNFIDSDAFRQLWLSVNTRAQQRLVQLLKGEDSGAVTLLDATRRERWLFEQEEPVRVLACSPKGQFTVFGTACGGVSLVDAEGSRRWEAKLPGEVVSVGVSADGGVCVSLVRPIPDDGTTRLFVLDSVGQTAWDLEFEKRIVGLALSPSGQYLAASGRDGSHTLYEVIFGQGGAGGHRAESLADTMRRTESIDGDQDWAEAVRLLCAALDERPSEVAACERLHEIREAQRTSLLETARGCQECADYAGALKALNTLREIAPEEPELYELLNKVRSLWSQRDVMRADALLEQGDYAGAGEALQGILQFAPHCLEARRRLAGLDVLRAKDADSEAERLLSSGDRAEGLAALERAQQIMALPHREEKIRRVQIDIDYQSGLRAYEEKRYREAVFQFKKVLARDPNHADARRHLNFAQRFEQDSNEALNDRFGRLE